MFIEHNLVLRVTNTELFSGCIIRGTRDTQYSVWGNVELCNSKSDVTNCNHCVLDDLTDPGTLYRIVKFFVMLCLASGIWLPTIQMIILPSLILKTEVLLASETPVIIYVSTSRNTQE